VQGATGGRLAVPRVRCASLVNRRRLLPPASCKRFIRPQVTCKLRKSTGGPCTCDVPWWSVYMGLPLCITSSYVASVDHTGLLRRSARCSVITQRARMQQRPSSEAASVSACAASCFVAQVRASREEKTASPIPAESHVAVCMPAARKEAI
jgi:hypothetical protein